MHFTFGMKDMKYGLTVCEMRHFVKTVVQRHQESTNRTEIEVD